MGRRTIELKRDFPMPVAQLFAILSEHEQLSAVLAPAKVKRVCNGHEHRNGVGSTRLVKGPLAPAIEEQVTDFRENELIQYRITRGAPVRNHLGTMRFSSTATGSHLHYTISFETAIPLLGPALEIALGQIIGRGLDKLAA